MLLCSTLHSQVVIQQTRGGCNKASRSKTLYSHQRFQQQIIALFFLASQRGPNELGSGLRWRLRSWFQWRQPVKLVMYLFPTPGAPSKHKAGDCINWRSDVTEKRNSGAGSRLGREKNEMGEGPIMRNRRVPGLKFPRRQGHRWRQKWPDENSA